MLLCVGGPSPRFLLLFFKRTLGLSKSHCEVSSESKNKKTKHSSSLSLSEQHIGYYVYAVSQFLMCSIYYLRILFLFKDRVKKQSAIECLLMPIYFNIQNRMSNFKNKNAKGDFFSQLLKNDSNL